MTLDLVTPPAAIEKKILTAIKNHLLKKLVGIEGKISKNLNPLIVSALSSSPETESILSGELRTELGITDPASQLSSIFDAIADATTVSFKPPSIRGRGVSMILTVSAVPFDLKSITAGLGTYTTEKGVEIPWFDWLTTLGDAVIVREHESVTGFPELSRTGDKIMTAGKGWRVPPQFAGRAEDNFVTRAIEQVLPLFEKSIVNTIGGAL